MLALTDMGTLDAVVATDVPGNLVANQTETLASSKKFR